MKNLTPLQHILVHDEALKRKPYKDSLGQWTIGVGHYIGGDLKDLEISPRVALELLKEDIEIAQAAVLNIFGEELFKSWSPARRDAITSLAFNMGEGNDKHGFRSFKNTIMAIKEERWDDAANGLRHSLWAKQVDPRNVINKGRDDRIIFMVQTGDYHAEYLLTPDALDS